MKIYTLTPNPALDLAGHVSALRSNEKNYVFRTRRDPGGNSINVARVAQRLGAEVVALGFVGGPTGEELQKLVEREGVRQAFTVIRATTRTNVTVTNDADHRQTRLTFPGPRVSHNEIQALRRAVARLRAPALLVTGGSLPQGCADSFYREVGEIAARRKIPVILDVPVKQLRASLRGGFRPLLIKPNIAELEELAGKDLKSERAILAAAQGLAKKAKIVCISLGDRGAYFVTDGKVWHAHSPKVKARGTVGAGDSMVGAMAARFAHYRSVDLPEAKLLDVFAWGLAAGAASAEAEGTAMAQPARVKSLRAKVKIKAVR